jgi:RNA polymerase sigma factor (sigma-70 family)
MGGAKDPDAELVAAAVAGNRDAFESLLRRHYDRVHGLAWHLTGTRADADDVAQDVCCALVEKIATYRGDSKFSTWLCGITVNACRDLKRRRRSLRGLADKLTVLAGLASVPDGRDAYDAVWLQSRIAKLKPAYREAVALVIGQQLSHAEAGEVLGVAEATISWRIHEAKGILAD